MTTGHLNGLLRQLRRAALLHDEGDVADGKLLEHFLAEHDETAFEALVRRHGPMVMGVCRRVLGNAHDAEDAFQATFLVLVRRAASIVPRRMVASWLYGVAYRTALGARTAGARRRAKERAMPRSEALEEDIWSKLRPLLDHELNHLPDKYRVPIVLCDLEGKSRKEAARQLGWSEGTLSGRLARARMLLAKRLAARGLTLSGGALAAALAQHTVLASVPATLLMSTVKAATLLAAGSATAAGMVPAKVAVLVQGVLRAMVMTKLKVATVCLLAVSVVGGGVGFISYPALVAAQPNLKEGAEPVPIPRSARPATVPLPPAPAADSKRTDRATIPPTSPSNGFSVPFSKPRYIQPADILNIKLVNPIEHVPEDFLGRHEVGTEGTIAIGKSAYLSVRGRTVEQVQGSLAHVLKRWHRPDLSYEDIKKNLRITIASAEEEAKQRQFQVRLFVMRVERVPGRAGIREEHRLETRPDLILLEGQEGICAVGQAVAIKTPQPAGIETMELKITSKVTDLRDGRLRMETKLERSRVERNDMDGTRVATQAVTAVDIVEPGDLVKVDMKNVRGELEHYMILSAARVETEPAQKTESAQKTAPQDHSVRVGAIKIVGNAKIPSNIIVQVIPLAFGAFIDDADLRRAEKNLARLGLRPTVVVLDPDDDSDFRDILITVREK